MDKTRCILTQLSQGAQPRLLVSAFPASILRRPATAWCPCVPVVPMRTMMPQLRAATAPRASVGTDGCHLLTGRAIRLPQPSVAPAVHVRVMGRMRTMVRGVGPRGPLPRAVAGRNAYLTRPVPRVNPRLGRAHADQLHLAPDWLRKVESVERFPGSARRARHPSAFLSIKIKLEPS